MPISERNVLTVKCGEALAIRLADGSVIEIECAGEDDSGTNGDSESGGELEPVFADPGVRLQIALPGHMPRLSEAMSARRRADVSVREEPSSDVATIRVHGGHFLDLQDDLVVELLRAPVAVRIGIVDD